MNEELNKALGIGGDDMPQHKKSQVQANTSSKRSTGDNAAENILQVVAYVLLVVGILAAIIVGITVGSIGYHNEGTGWLIFIGGTIGSFVSWAMIMVIVNISVNIRHIKHYLSERQ